MSQVTRLPRAVLDADIIFSRVLHELMGRAADDLRLFDLLWSEELLAEARRSLVEKKGLSKEVAARWVGYLSQGFPVGRVDISTVPQDLDLRSLTRDPEDAHVCALAIAGNADYLFTFDRAYLKDPLRLHGIEVPDLDEYPDPARMWRHLLRLSDAAEAFRKADGQIKERFDKWVHTNFGIEVANHDVGLREAGGGSFEFEGTTHSRERHIKVDDYKAPSECGRIYFALDTEKKRIIVDHIGLHL